MDVSPQDQYRTPSSGEGGCGVLMERKESFTLPIPLALMASPRASRLGAGEGGGGGLSPSPEAQDQLLTPQLQRMANEIEEVKEMQSREN